MEPMARFEGNRKDGIVATVGVVVGVDTGDGDSVEDGVGVEDEVGVWIGAGLGAEAVGAGTTGILPPAVPPELGLVPVVVKTA